VPAACSNVAKDAIESENEGNGTKECHYKEVFLFCYGYASWRERSAPAKKVALELKPLLANFWTSIYDYMCLELGIY